MANIRGYWIGLKSTSPASAIPIEQSLFLYRMKKTMIRFAIPLAGLITLFFASGCQTAEGFGKDLQGLGERIEDRAR